MLRVVYCCLFLILLQLALHCANSGSAVVIIFSMTCCYWLWWLWRAHQQIEGKSNDEEEAERGGECLIGCGGHENVLVFIDANHAI